MLENDLPSLWEQRLAEYESSGKSIKAWCQEEEIKENRFYYWRRKLRSEPVKKEQSVKWLSLALDECKQTNLKKGFDQHLLREIVQVLQTL